MATQTIIIGKQKEPITTKEIEFAYFLNSKLQLEECNRLPRDFKFIELICKDYDEDVNDKPWDLIFAYDDMNNRSEGLFIVGRWNLGIVQ